MIRRPRCPRNGTLLALVVGVGTIFTESPVEAQVASTASLAVPAVPTGLLPGDVVRVWIWRELDYTGDFPVDPRGMVALPLLGEVDVSDTGSRELVAELKSAYRQYLRNPSIQVMVLRRVAIQGYVASPGLYPVDESVTVAQAIALAGGISGVGDANKVRLLRDGRVIVARLGPDTILRSTALRSGDEIFVPQRGWLSRNSNVLLWGAVSVGVSVAISVLVN